VSAKETVRIAIKKISIIFGGLNVLAST